ncbi:DUF4432 domain-containing protein [Trueperella pyogenes]|uniref:DUF4432 domain-containing protein n=1 Tax=Trueperella pyogenes TaxID=1661 RepID=UPI003248EB14
MYTLTLHEQFFDHTPQTIISSGALRVITKRYSSGIASLTIANERGHVEVLPFMGQIIWDAVFDGHSLRMKNMFPEPRPATEITDTYGCFAFHSGLLAAGCPSPDDDHPLHGEFPCAPMQEAWLEITEDSIRVVSMREYVKGFGHHYRAMPSVKLAAGSAQFDIELAVTNLSEYQPMPLQYMCHMNYAFVEGGQMSQSLPEGAFQLRRSIPAHVTPTARWKDINAQILAGEIDADSLDVAKEFPRRSSTSPTTCPPTGTISNLRSPVRKATRSLLSFLQRISRWQPDGCSTMQTNRWPLSFCPARHARRGALRPKSAGC